MPALIYVLALAVFAQGTSEFMLAGILVPLSTDLGVSPASAGSLTSAFALGMVVGAPAMAVLSRRWRPEPALMCLLAAFVLCHVIGALTSSFALLFIGRVLAAIANAGFLAVALTLAGRLVGPARMPRAIAVLLAGTTLATVAGAPLGALLAGIAGWRAAFWGIALLCLPVLAWLCWSPRRSVEPARVPAIRRELAVLRTPAVVGSILVAALVNAGTFGVLTYLEVIGIDAGMPHGLGPVMLMLFGGGAFLGVSAAGRWGQRWPRRWIGVSVLVLPFAWAVAALAAVEWPVLMAMAAVCGAAAFAAGAALISRIVTTAGDAPTLGGAYATSALNVGAFAGPLIGGPILAVQGPAAVPWAAAALAVAAIALLPLAFGESRSRS